MSRRNEKTKKNRSEDRPLRKSRERGNSYGELGPAGGDAFPSEFAVAVLRLAAGIEWNRYARWL